MAMFSKAQDEHWFRACFYKGNEVTLSEENLKQQHTALTNGHTVALPSGIAQCRLVSISTLEHQTVSSQR